MPEDLAFKIQLGIILPKMKEKLAAETSIIVEDVVNIVKAGTRADEEFSMEPVKEIIMKDFEIFLDDCILPELEKKLSPPEEEVPAEEASEEEASEESTTEETDE